ncbi:MAG: DUF2628 domain-containing protein [Burkholderiales bacterium]|nr:DUF2628 domain-containing protein [Burkholderiales bacterium]
MKLVPKNPVILLRHSKLGYVTVSQGFSLSAFFLGSIWAIVKRTWLVFVGLFVVEVVLWYLNGVATVKRDFVTLLGLMLVNVALAICRGKYANRWLLASLRRRGYGPWPVADDKQA